MTDEPTYQGSTGQTARVNALGLALHRGPPRTAMCPRCPDEVLVSTLRFRGAEFYCLGCKGLFSFVDPRPAETTPELEERIEQAKARFQELFP